MERDGRSWWHSTPIVAIPVLCSHWIPHTHESGKIGPAVVIALIATRMKTLDGPGRGKTFGATVRLEVALPEVTEARNTHSQSPTLRRIQLAKPEMGAREWPGW